MTTNQNVGVGWVNVSKVHILASYFSKNQKMPTRKWGSGVGMDKEYGMLVNELVRKWDIAHDDKLAL